MRHRVQFVGSLKKTPSQEKMGIISTESLVFVTYLITAFFFCYFIDHILTAGAVFFESKHACLHLSCLCMEVLRQQIIQAKHTFLHKRRNFLKYLEATLLKCNVISQLVIFQNGGVLVTQWSLNCGRHLIHCNSK